MLLSFASLREAAQVFSDITFTLYSSSERISSAAARFELLTLIFGGSPSRATLTGKLSLLLIGPAMVPTRPLYVAETFWRTTASPTAKRAAAASN